MSFKKTDCKIKRDKKKNPKKALGYDLITGQIMKSLPEKVIRKLLHIINESFRLK